MLNELLSHLLRYVLGYCDVEELESWLVSNLQTILNSRDELAIEIANQIDTDLVEIGEGLLDELALRKHLHSYLNSVETIDITDVHSVEISSSASGTTILPFPANTPTNAESHCEGPTSVADYGWNLVPA